MYARKTHDVWEIWSNYGYGDERVCTETSYKDLKENIKAYRENEPGYPHWVVQRRVRNEVSQK